MNNFPLLQAKKQVEKMTRSSKKGLSGHSTPYSRAEYIPDPSYWASFAKQLDPSTERIAHDVGHISGAVDIIRDFHEEQLDLLKNEIKSNRKWTFVAVTISLLSLLVSVIGSPAIMRLVSFAAQALSR